MLIYFIAVILSVVDCIAGHFDVVSWC